MTNFKFQVLDQPLVDEGLRSYVKVAKNFEEEVIELPTDADGPGALPLAAVCAMFGATSAIKYRIMEEDDGTTGWRWRGLLLEQGKFYPPEDGWQDRTYIVVQTDQKSIIKHYPIIKVED